MSSYVPILSRPVLCREMTRYINGRSNDPASTILRVYDHDVVIDTSNSSHACVNHDSASRSHVRHEPVSTLNTIPDQDVSHPA